MLFLSVHHTFKKMKIEMRVLYYYFFNAADQRFFLSSIISLAAYFFAQSFLFALIFPSPPAPLGVMLDPRTYVETRASDYSP